MALTIESGPLVSTGQQPSLNGYTPDYNADAGPSMAWGGMGILDPRFGVNQSPQPGEPAVIGFVGGYIETLNAIPTASAVNNIVGSAVPVAGTAMTLTTSATSSAVTQIATAVQVLASRNVIPAKTLVLDGLPGLLATNNTSTSSVQWYAPASNLSRAVKVVSAGNDGSAAFTVAGYDIYGYPMTERITGTSGSTGNGKKAFKFISSVTPSGTVSGSNVSVGTQDVFGFPIRCPFFPLVDIYWNSALITATTGWTAAVGSAATSVTGDVRGTYAVQSAANGTLQLEVFSKINAVTVQTMGTTGLFGVPQS
jgi:hypothetical protein